LEIGANAGANNFPKITTIPLASTDTGFGGSNQAMTSLLGVREPDFVVSPYDGVSSSANFNTLQSNILTLNGATRTDMQQFGSFGVVFNRSVPASTPSQLPAFNTVNMIGCWLPDSATGALAPVYSVAQSAAACAAVIAQQGIPFNPLDRVVVNGLSAPNLMSDWITVGAGLESETALNQGWTPMRVNPNSQVAFVRTVTGLVTNASNAAITAYYDVQDWQVLYFWRKTLWTRFTQPDIANQKASQAEAQLILSEIIRLANVFQDNNMFEQVQQLAKMFIVQRNSTDRSRFDVQTPVNVIPGLHVIAVNVIGTTLFDNFTV
jgi:phage tail sheath gpL-like